MKCSIDSNGIKSWGRAIHTLALIGDNDVHFQFSETTLTLSAFDTSLSVCATANFSKPFFTTYLYTPDDVNLSCRVPAKCLLKPFRSMRFLTKGISMCEIVFESTSDCMEVVLTCKFGARINYSIHLTSEAECLQVDYDLTLLTNMITAEAKLIIGSLSNFNYNKGAGDLTLKATGSKLFFRNCITDLVKKEGKVYTELSLNPVDFTEFAIQEDGELTFPLREFRTFASFAETMKLPVTIYFQNSSEPVVIKLKNEIDFYEATLTLATKTMKQTGSISPGSISSGTISHVSSQASTTNHPDEPEPINFHPGRVSHIRVSNISLLRNDDPEPIDFHNDDVSNIQAPNISLLRGSDDREFSPHRSAPRSSSRSTEPAAKKMKALFPNVRGGFNPAVDIPGHNVVLIGESDSESE